MQIPTTGRKRGIYPQSEKPQAIWEEIEPKFIWEGKNDPVWDREWQRRAQSEGSRSPKPAPTRISAIAHEHGKSWLPSSFCAWNIQRCSGRDAPKPAAKTSYTLNTLAVCSSKRVHIFYIKDGMKRFWTRWISAWLRDWIVLGKLHRALKGIV